MKDGFVAVDHTRDARLEILKTMPKVKRLCKALEKYAATDDYFNGQHFAYAANLLEQYSRVLQSLGRSESLNYSIWEL